MAFAVTLLIGCASMATTSPQEIEEAVHGLTELKDYSVTLIATPPGVHYAFGDDYSKIGVNSLTAEGQNKIINALKMPDNECGASLIVSLYKTLKSASETQPQGQVFAIRIDLQVDVDKQRDQWRDLAFSSDPRRHALAEKFVFDYFREPFAQVQVCSSHMILTQSNRFQKKYEPMYNVGSKFIEYNDFAVGAKVEELEAQHPEWPAEDFAPQSCQMNQVGLAVLLAPSRFNY